MAIVTKTATLIPSGYTGVSNLTTSSSYPVSNGYKASGDTSNYARFTLSTSTEGHLYYKFDTSIIPDGATITSVSASVTVRVNNTTRVTNTKSYICSGSTAKGSAATFASTTASNTITLTTNTTLFRSDLNDLRILIGATGSSSTSSKYIYFYGATMTITYTVATHDITISNSTSATVTASETEVDDGSDVEIYADTVSGITVKDNGVDVTSQFAQLSGGTISAVPGEDVTEGFSASGAAFYQSSSTSSDAWLRYAIGHSAESPYSTSNTSNTYVKPEGDTGWINYHFDFSEVPTTATITSMSVKVYGARENATIDTSHVARFQCYSGSTAKGTRQDFTSTSNGLVTVTDPGTWTAAELHDAQLRFEVGYYGGRMLGITWAVTYQVSGYVYTITNVSTDHTIVVTESGGTEAIYYKDGGSWVQASAVYKKINGAWVQQSDLTAVFDSSKNYVRG